MLKSRHIDKICVAVTAAAMIITALFMYSGSAGIIAPAHASPEYADRLFDLSVVHSVDIITDSPELFTAEYAQEIYAPCTVIIDGEAFSNVGVRVKGNNSRVLTKKYGHDRFSLKVEFDRYAPGSYYGLDKFSLDASFQDNSYMKTLAAFDMMRFMQVPTPLCSYALVSINGEARGLYLAVEEMEEAFAKRCFSSDHGLLYKPDYVSLNDENSDVALKYTGDGFENYENIFSNAKFKITDEDKRRLINALYVLSTGENLETAINVDEVLRYFTVQVFTVNLDSYLGRTGHNYFLYEKNGVLSILPWDYNLAFATYSLGMPNPVNDSTLYVNYPIDTPADGEIMLNRPLYHNVMKNSEYFKKYREYFDYFIGGYFESGYFEKFISKYEDMIKDYVASDPTAFCTAEEHTLAVRTLERFCLLRAKSVRGQLEGTIPSTIKGQSEDSSSFIDASEVWLPDMGELADLE